MVVVNGVKRRGAVGAIAVRQAFSVLTKAPSPLEVNGFDRVVWRVDVETLMEACSTWWMIYAVESSVDIVGISDLPLMRLTVVLLELFSRLV